MRFLCIALVCARTSLGASLLPSEGVIPLEGDYAGHLQDVWWDGGTNIWWAHTQQILRTDLSGKILAKADVEGHNAGLEVRDGRLYVVTCSFCGKTTPECHPQINVHDAVTLKLLEKHILEGLTDRSGSFAILPDGSFVVGCLRPPDIEMTQVRLHHLGSDYRLLESVVLDNVEVKRGIETIKYRDGELFLSMYSGAGLLVVLDAKTFKEKRRQQYNGCFGLVFDGDSAWCGRSAKNAETGRHTSSLVRCALPDGCVPPSPSPRER